MTNWVVQSLSKCRLKRYENPDISRLLPLPQCTSHCTSLYLPGLPSCIQLFRERLCRKKCTRQSRKVLWVVLSSLSFKEIWKNVTRGHGRMFASARGKQQKRVRHLQCQEQCIDHIPYYLSGLSRALFFRQPFSKQLYTMYIISRTSLPIGSLEGSFWIIGRGNRRNRTFPPPPLHLTLRAVSL